MVSSPSRNIVGWSIIFAAAGLVAWRGFPLTFAGLALATVGLTVLSPARGRLVQYFLWSLFSATAGVVVLWPGSIDMPVLVRAGLAAFCFSWATRGVLHLVGALRGRSPSEAFIQGFGATAIGYVAAGCLVGVAGLIHGHAAGFIVAYGAFSVAWLFYWVSRALKRDNSDRPPADAERHL